MHIHKNKKNYQGKYNNSLDTIFQEFLLIPTEMQASQIVRRTDFTFSL